MGNYSYTQSDFRGGLWDKDAQGRTTDEKWKTALQVNLNAWSLEAGAWSRRPGFRYVCTTRRGVKARMLPFRFGRSEAYQAVLTAGGVTGNVVPGTENIMRFVVGLGLLMDETAAPGVLGVEHVDTVGYGQSYGSAYGGTTEHVVVSLTSVPSTWAVFDTVIFQPAIPPGSYKTWGRQFEIGTILGDTIYIVDPITRAPPTIDDFVLRDPLDGIKRVLEVDTPYDEDQIAGVRLAQAIDNVLFFHGGVAPWVLKESGTTQFTFAAADFHDGPYFDVNETTTTLTPSAATGTISVAASSTVGINDGDGFQSTDVGRLIRFQCGPPQWGIATVYTKNSKVIGSDNNIYRAVQGGIGHDPTSDDGTYWEISPDTVFWTWLQITAVTDTTHITALVRGDDLQIKSSSGIFSGSQVTLAATTAWRLGVYSDTTGFPTCGTYWEGRLFLAGAVSNRIDSTKSFGIPDPTHDYFDFAPTYKDGTVADDSALSFVLNSKDVNPVLWMLGGDAGLAVGTASAEWMIKASQLDDPLTPFDTQGRPITTSGCADIEPTQTWGAAVFVQARQRKVLANRQVAVGLSAKSEPQNISFYAGGLMAPGISDLAWAQEPAMELAVLKTDNTLVGCSYKFSLTEESYMGWHTYEHGARRSFEAISYGPSFQGTGDALYAVTNSTSDVSGSSAGNFLGLALTPHSGDTFSVGASSYTLVSALTSDNQILIGANDEITTDYIVDAINGGAGSGSTRSANIVAHPFVGANVGTVYLYEDQIVNRRAVSVFALADGTFGNTIAVSQSSGGRLRWGTGTQVASETTLKGGVDSVSSGAVGVRWVETIMPVATNGDAQWAAWHTDASSTAYFIRRMILANGDSFDGIRVYGLDHLDNITIHPWIGGLDLGNFVVSGGRIDIPYSGAFTLAFLEGLNDGTDYGDGEWGMKLRWFDAAITSLPQYPLNTIAVIGSDTGSHTIYDPSQYTFHWDRTAEVAYELDVSARSVRVYDAFTGELVRTAQGRLFFGDADYPDIVPVRDFSLWYSQWILSASGRFLFGPTETTASPAYGLFDTTELKPAPANPLLGHPSEVISGIVKSPGVSGAPLSFIQGGHDFTVYFLQSSVNVCDRIAVFDLDAISFGEDGSVGPAALNDFAVPFYQKWDGSLISPPAALPFNPPTETALAGCRGFETSNSGAVFYVWGKNGNQGDLTTSAFRLYKFSVDGAIPDALSHVNVTYALKKTFVPSDFDASWTAFKSDISFAADLYHGGLVGQVYPAPGDGGATGYLFRLSPSTYDILWKVTVPLDEMPVAERFNPMERLTSGYAAFMRNRTSGNVDNEIAVINLLDGSTHSHVTGQVNAISGLAGSPGRYFFDAKGPSMIFWGQFSTTTPVNYTPLGGFATDHFHTWSSRWNRLWIGDAFPQDQDHRTINADYLFVPTNFGVSFTSRGQLLPPDFGQDAGARAGPGFGKIRRNQWWAAKFIDSYNVSIGTNFDKLEPVKFITRATGVAVSTPDRFTGTLSGELRDDYTFDGALAWETTRQYPTTISVIGAYIETQDK